MVTLIRLWERRLWSQNWATIYLADHGICVTMGRDRRAAAPNRWHHRGLMYSDYIQVGRQRGSPSKMDRLLEESGSSTELREAS